MERWLILHNHQIFYCSFQILKVQIISLLGANMETTLSVSQAIYNFKEILVIEAKNIEKISILS